MNEYRLITLGVVRITGILSLALLLISCENSEPVLTTQSYDFEIVPDDEASKIADIAKKTMKLQITRAKVFEAQKGQILRGVHPKSHGCVVADLVINKDIVPNYQVGLFSKPGKKYNALIRYSNASVRLSPDLEKGKNGSRGMAIKIFDVDGEMLVKDKGSNNQDFLMINTPGFAFPDVQSYQRLSNALVNSPSGADPTCALVEPGSPTALQLGCIPVQDWTAEDDANLKKTRTSLGIIQSKTVRNPTEVQYFAAAPSSFGHARVMKFSVEPCGGEKDQKPFTKTEVSKISENYLNEALVATMSQDENVCLDLQVQVLNIDQVKADRNRTDISGDVIEDATREWNESESAFGFTRVATITVVTPQTVDLSDATQKDCKSQSFNPWHSLTAHQPLGGINRLRKPVYINSAGNRLRK